MRIAFVVAHSSIELVALIERRDSRVHVIDAFMTPENGEPLSFFIQQPIDPATGKRYVL